MPRGKPAKPESAPRLRQLWLLFLGFGLAMPFVLPIALSCLTIRWSPYFLQIYGAEVALMVACGGIVAWQTAGRSRPGCALILLFPVTFALGWVLRFRLMIACFWAFVNCQASPAALQADLAREISYWKQQQTEGPNVSFRVDQGDTGSPTPQFLKPWIARLEPRHAFITRNFGSEPVLVADYSGGFLDPFGLRIGSPTFVHPGSWATKGNAAPSPHWPTVEIAPGVWVYGCTPP